MNPVPSNIILDAYKQLGQQNNFNTTPTADEVNAKIQSQYQDKNYDPVTNDQLQQALNAASRQEIQGRLAQNQMGNKINYQPVAKAQVSLSDSDEPMTMKKSTSVLNIQVQGLKAQKKPPSLKKRWRSSNNAYASLLTGGQQNKLQRPLSPRARKTQVTTQPEENRFNFKSGVDPAKVSYQLPGLGTISSVNGSDVYNAPGILIDNAEASTSSNVAKSRSRHLKLNKLLANTEHAPLAKIAFLAKSSKNNNLVDSTRKSCSKNLYALKDNIKIGDSAEAAPCSVSMKQSWRGLVDVTVKYNGKKYTFSAGAQKINREDATKNSNLAKFDSCCLKLDNPPPFYAVQALSHFGFKNLANALDPASQVSATQPAKSPHLNQEPIKSSGDFQFTPVVSAEDPIYPPLMRQTMQDALDLIESTDVGQKLLRGLEEMGIKNVEHRFAAKGATIDWDHDYKANNTTKAKDVKYFMNGDPTRGHHFPAIDVKSSKNVKFLTQTAPTARVVFHELVHAYHTGGTTNGRKVTDNHASKLGTENGMGSWHNFEELHTITGIQANDNVDPINELAFLAELGIKNPRASHGTTQELMDASNYTKEFSSIGSKDIINENVASKVKQDIKDVFSNYNKAVQSGNGTDESQVVLEHATENVTI